MKVRKNGIELTINPKDKSRYEYAGWEVKYERKPEDTRRYYEQKKAREGKE